MRATAQSCSGLACQTTTPLKSRTAGLAACCQLLEHGHAHARCLFEVLGVDAVRDVLRGVQEVVFPAVEHERRDTTFDESGVVATEATDQGAGLHVLDLKLACKGAHLALQLGRAD